MKSLRDQEIVSWWGWGQGHLFHHEIISWWKWGEKKILFPHPHHETISWSRGYFIKPQVKKSLKIPIKTNP